MRTIRFIIMLFIVVSLTLMSSTITTAQASADEDFRAIYPNNYAPGINKPCPTGSDKMFIAVLTVPKGQKITAYGEMYLELKNDKFLFDDAGNQVSDRKVEFYFFPQSRKSRVLLNDLRDSLVYASYTGHYYSLKLRAQCNEALGM